MSNYVLGITMTLLGTAINNFGLVLQKWRINRRISSVGTKTVNPDISKPQAPSPDAVTDLKGYLRDPWWILGILMQVIFCVPFYFLALEYIGLTLAQPLSNAGVIFLVMGLVFGVKERLRPIEIGGMVLLILGMVLVGMGGVTGEITLASFLSPPAQQAFWLMNIFLLVFCVIGGLCIWKIPRIRVMALALLSGCFYALVSIGSQIVVIVLDDLSSGISIILLIYGIIAFLLGTIFAILCTQEAFKRSQAVNIIPFSQLCS